MKVEVFGGVGEIGGNKIVVEHKNTKILLDIGMSFERYKKFFSEFMQPRKCAGLSDFFKLGLLPDIPGLYREDYLRHMGRGPEPRGFDAVFLSHAHADHSAYLHFVRSDIPVICSKATYLILKALQETSSGAFKDFLDCCEAFAIRKTKKGGYARVDRRNKEYITERKFIILDSEESVRIGDLELKLVLVDHSLPGASAAIIYSDSGYVVYTGDFRFHGDKYKLTQRFVELAAEARPKVLICEGTHIDKQREESEEGVLRRASDLVSRTSGLVVVSFPIRDTSRLQTFLEVARRNDRYLTISLRQAYLLKLFEDEGIEAPRLNDPNLKIYIPRKSWGLINRKDYPENIRLLDYEKWERKFLDYPNAITYEDVKANQGKYILQLAPWEISQLLDVEPKGGIYIRSACEPFDEEMLIDEKRLKNWLDHFGLDGIYQIHASGHAPGPQIREMIARISPEEIVWVHGKGGGEVVGRGSKG